MAITFYLQSKKNPASIYVRIRMGKEIDAKANIHLKVNPDNFNKGEVKLFRVPSGADASVKKEVKEKNQSLIDLQNSLDNLKHDLTNLLNSRKDYETINTEWLKGIINPKKDSEVPQALTDYFDYYIDFKRNSLSPSTLKQLAVFKNRVLKFEETYDKVYIPRVNKKFSLALQQWGNHNGYASNTILKTLKVIKTVCNHAKENGIPTDPQLDSITKGLKYKKTEHIHLNFEEIKQIISTDIKDKRKNIAKDWLIISCYTAQRVSDFLRFTKNDVVIMEGINFLDISQDKTGQPVYIPLDDEVMKILNKRNGEFPPVFSKNVESNKATYNLLIKEVCRLAKINNLITANIRNKETNRYEIKDVPKYKAVSTHIGRRSFATNYYGKINTALLVSATGHASEQQFLRYVGKTGTQNALMLAKEMRRISLNEGNEPQLRVIKNSAK